MIRFDLGIFGDGQLARMTAQVAIQWGLKVAVLGKTHDSPAAQVGASVVIGDLRQASDLARFVEQCDALTFDTEHCNAGFLATLPGAYKISPDPQSMVLVGDKFLQKSALREKGIPTADFGEIKELAEAKYALVEHGAIYIKTRRNGYDGRGCALVKSADEIDSTLRRLVKVAGGGEDQYYWEKAVALDHEITIIACRDYRGATNCFPIIMTEQENGQCNMAYMLRRYDLRTEGRAAALAGQVMELLPGRGVFAIEMFVSPDGTVLVNEIAPRVHNSGHLTIEACKTSQFEAQVRCALGLRVGDLSAKVDDAVMVNILGGTVHIPDEKWLRPLALPDTYVHRYGKSDRWQRKLGHVTLTSHAGLNKSQLRAMALQARAMITE